MTTHDHQRRPGGRMSDDLLLTDDQIDKLLDALAAGNEGPVAADDVRAFLVYVELRLRDAALICGTLNGHFTVKLTPEGWDFMRPNEEDAAA